MFQGRIQGDSLGSGEPPLRDKEIFLNSCREEAEFGQVNHLGSHEKEGWGKRGI